MARAFIFILLLSLSACIPIPVHQEVPAETDTIDIPEQQFGRIVVAPYFHRAEVNDFGKVLSATGKSIEIVDAATMTRKAFPERDPNTEFPIDDLLLPDARGRLMEAGVRYIVVLSPYHTTTTEGDGTFVGVYAHGYSMVSTKLLAGFVDLEDPASAEFHESKARGKDSATWILPYLGLFVFGSVPETEEGAMSGMARQMAVEIGERSPEQSVKVMVLAGNWESAETSYKSEQALKALQEKAAEGDSDAQWQFYAGERTSENLIWLCRAADQGNDMARAELGRLYFYGSEKYGVFEDLHIDNDLSRSCMWFHLAGRADIDDTAAPERVQVPKRVYESVEVERTTKAMTERQLAEAKLLLLNWEPGQCDRDFWQYLGGGYAKESALAKLCTAADLEDFTSREELGRIYFFGSSGVPEDLPRAYMWYRLAENVYVPPGDAGRSMQSVCDTMTAEQRDTARQLLGKWKAGQCKRELVSPGN